MAMSQLGMRSSMGRAFGPVAGLGAVLLALSACPASEGNDPEPSSEPEAVVYENMTPRWAFEPWISKDISDGPDTYDFVDGFIERDIPVGVVVIDSPWETNYNTFLPNPDRYPAFKTMVDDLHAKDVRIVMWVTQMVNESSFDLEDGGDDYPQESPNYRQAARDDYYVNEGETYVWWKGSGAAVDFFNPDAVDWFHGEQQKTIDLGIDGWKLDFGEQYISTLPIRTADGEKSLQEYSEAYYEDFLRYGREQKGTNEFVTMVRPYDESYGFEGRFYARPEHSPVAWVGDNFRNWVGISDVLDHTFRSAEVGYVVIGSDIGGYLRIDNDTLEQIPYDAPVFMQWTAMAGFTPFFQLHGQQNLTPWTSPDQTDLVLETYRYWATLHHEMVPFWFSAAEQGYKDGVSLTRPVGDAASWPGDYRFFAVDAFFVAPMLEETLTRDIDLPSGHRYLDFYERAQAPIDGGTTLTDQTYPAERVPAFIVDGAIVPMHGSSTITGFAPEAGAEGDVVFVWPKPDSTVTFTNADEAGPVVFTASEAGGKATVTITNAPDATYLVVHRETAPTAVTIGDTVVPVATAPAALAVDNAYWRASTHDVVIHCGKRSESIVEID